MPRQPLEPPNLPREYLELMTRKRYSSHTIQTYTSYFRDFIRYFSDRDLKSITTDQIKQYLHVLIQSRKISASQQN